MLGKGDFFWTAHRLLTKPHLLQFLVSSQILDTLSCINVKLTLQMVKLKNDKVSFHFGGQTCHLTRDRLGGGVGSDPPRFFLNSIRGVTGIDAKLGIPLHASIWRLFAKFWKFSQKLFEICRFKWQGHLNRHICDMPFCNLTQKSQR